MRSHGKRGFRPQLEGIENRCLLSLAVLEVLNKSTYDITFDLRWTASSAWSTYSESPGQGEIFSTGYSSSLTPQVLVNTTTHAGSETTYSLVQGYGDWNGSGTPPASAASLYEFQNTTTGIGLSYISPPTATDAVVSVQNSSSYTITFDFRWTSTASWTTYTEASGQDEVFSTAYSTGLSPQVLYDTSSSPSSQTDCSLSQGYSQWTGTGTPPASAGTPYAFENSTTGVQLFYTGGSTGPAPAPNPVVSSNWSGYVAETSLSQPQANSVTEVIGSWIVPKVTGPSTGSTNSAVWVGIDGASNNTVEQTGTSENVINGQPTYYAWWEMYSSGKQQPGQPITTMTVEPGDSITASVQYFTTGAHAGQFYLSIVDSSRTNDSFGIYTTSAQYQSPLAQRSSAEWIVEAPESAGSISTLANFGQVTFTNATAVINGVSGPINDSAWQSQAWDMGSGSVVYDTTSVLTNSGTSFVVTYNSSAGAAVKANSNTGAGTVAGAAVGTNLGAGQKIASPVLRGPAWTGASVVSGFRTAVRQIKRPAQGFSSDPLRN